MTEIANAGDIKAAYMQVFDSFALVPGDIVESSEGRVNMRYARELLATLVANNLVVISEGGEGNDGEDVWQTYPDTYDNIDRDEAERRIDEFLRNTPTIEAVASNPKGNTKMTATKPVTGQCYCGCGAPLTGKSFYKPGHDARHAGIVGRKVAETGEDEYYADLPSNALVEKARRITANTLAKQAKKDKPKVDNKTEDGTIKVGKNEYVAVRDTETGEVAYFKGDETLTASKTAAKTFTVG